MPRRRTQTSSADDRVLEILNTITAKGMNLASFLEAYFDSSNHRIKSRVGMFFQMGGMRRVFHAMMQSSKFGANRRSTATATAEIATSINEDMVRLVLRILRHEMKSLSQDERSRIDPTSITPLACADFNFKDIQQLYEEKAPTLWKVVRILSGVSGLQPPEDAHEDNDLDDGDLGDREDEDLEDRENEDLEDRENDIDNGSPEPVVPGYVPNGDEDEWVDIGELDIDLPGAQTPPNMNRSNWVTEDDLQTTMREREGRMQKGRKHRVRKDRNLMATTALSIMLYGRSRWNNNIQVSSKRPAFVLQ
jgi:hypothetical protein